MTMDRRSALTISALPFLIAPTPPRKAPSMQLPPGSGTDDTAVIQSALSSTRAVTGQPGETYRISAPLVIGSGTTLDMSGCTIVLLPGSNCHMLETPASRSSDIVVRGGTWARGTNAGDGNDRHSLFFRRVDRLTVEGLRVTSAAGKYAVAVGDATRVRVRDIDLDTFSDGVHITGPADMVEIRSIMGTTGDDQVALTGRDYLHYDDVRGNITNVTIADIFCKGSLSAVKIASGAGDDGPQYVVQGVSATHLYGTTLRPPVAIMQDQTGPTVANGIVISDVDAQCTDPTLPPVWLRGIASTDITIRDWRMRRPLTNNPMVLVDGVTRINSLTIDGWLMDPGAVTAANIVGVFSGAKVDALRISRMRVPVGWTGKPVVVGAGGTVVSSAVFDLYGVTY